MAQNKNTKKRRASSDQPSKIKRLWIIFGCCWGALFLFFFMLSMGWLGFMPSFEELENPQSNQATEVISADGEILGFIGVENRSNVTYDQLSPNLVNALVATEDVRFYKHSGIDARSLGRVLFKTIIGRHSSSGGGSTITQQLAKNLFPREKKGKLGVVYSKLKEWIVAVKLEHNYSKEEIITMYLNTVDFGSNAFGIKTAAKTFFDKSPADLDINESAMLVGLLKAPTSYSPVLNPDNALMRRNTVLGQLAHYDYITDEECDSLAAIPIDVSRYSPQTHNEGLATYFREYIRNYMKEWCKTTKVRKPNGDRYDVHKDGLRIYTTIDSRMQRYAEDAVRKHMGGEMQPAFFREIKNNHGSPFVRLSKAEEEKILNSAMKQTDRYRAMKSEGMSEKEIAAAFRKPVKMRVFSWSGHKDTVMSPWDSILYHKKFLNAGLMAVEPGTGYVKAYVGGINYRFFKYDNVWTRRQVGSTFKPFVYTMALRDLGMHPCTQVPNMQICIETGGGGQWCPRNSSHARENEMVTLKWGLANSVNWVSAYLMKQAIIQCGGNNTQGAKMVINLARNMGVESPIDPVPAICVGTPELTVYEMAGAMATYANQGEYVKPIFITRIEDSKGTVIQRFTADQRNEALDPNTAYMMISLMKGVVDNGTGGRLRYKYKIDAPMAGKTGTTQNNSDCWFVGITPKLATAVWTGGEIRSIHFRNMAYGQGASQALPIFAYFMQGVYNDPKLKFPRTDFTRPAGVDVDSLLNCNYYHEAYDYDIIEGGWAPDDDGGGGGGYNEIIW
ncbi:MAG: penicillin-binding protein [Bacteroidales bacterium]|nr:penicillin-binding protein [Bacteroidales bacterium]